MSNTSQIESRLRRMERKMRFFQGMTLVLILLVGLLVGSSFRTAELIPDVLRAKRVEVVDDDGNALMVLRKSKTADDYEAGIIESFYENKTPLWYLGQAGVERSSAFYLFNKNGKPMHQMGLDEEIKEPYFTWYSRDGEMLGYVGAANNGSGSVWLFEKDGETLKLLLTQCKNGNGCICTYDNDGSSSKCYGID